MFEVIYKYLLILLLIVTFIFLSSTGILFIFGIVDESGLFWHKFFGIVLVVSAIIHTIIKRKKLKKLTKEFINIFSNKKVSLDHDMDLLIESLENKTIKEICEIFNLSFEEFNKVFQDNKISFSSKEQSLKEISKDNSIKLFSIVVMILDYKANKDNNSIK